VAPLFSCYSLVEPQDTRGGLNLSHAPLHVSPLLRWVQARAKELKLRAKREGAGKADKDGDDLGEEALRQVEADFFKAVQAS